VKRIKENFFQITFDGTKQLYKYRIDLGSVNQKEPRKRDLLRFLIGSLLKANNPDSEFWACDYFLYIILAGHLWNDGSTKKLLKYLIYARIMSKCTPPSFSTVKSE
jgi:hypothetical protein